MKPTTSVRKRTLQLVRAAVIAALYTVLTMFMQPLAFGPVQFRVSEALTVLPLLMAEAIPGLAIGCFLANILGGFGPADFILGTLATLIAAVLTRYSRKLYIGVLPPIIVNMLIVPAILLITGVTEAGYFIDMLSIGLSQSIAVIGLGVPLYFAVKGILKVGRLGSAARNKTAAVTVQAAPSEHATDNPRDIERK